MSTPNRFDTYIRDSQEAACDAFLEADRELIARMEDRADMSAQLTAYAVARTVARWWEYVVTEIDHAAEDPVDALWKARQAALRHLTDHRMPGKECMFAYGFEIARMEGTRRFYQATAHLEALTKPAEGVPV